MSANMWVLGRLVRDVEVRYAANGDMPIGKFTVATDRSGKEKKTDFWDCTAFGKTAETIEKFFRKGNRILVSGEPVKDEYTNKDGNKVRTASLNVEKFFFVESKAEKEDSAEKKTDGDGFLKIPEGDDLDLPFE